MGFAPDYTPRYRFKYIVAGVPHTIQFRGARGTTVASAVGDFTNVAYDCFNVFNLSLATDFQWVAADGCEQNDDLFFPIALPDPVTGHADPTAWSGNKRIRGATFSGRARGSRARITIYGLNLNSDNEGTTGGDGLMTLAEAPDIATLVASLNAFACAGSGEPAV